MIETREIAASGMAFTVAMSGPDGADSLICLHGFPNSRHSWHYLLDDLAAAGLRGVAPDQRGYSPGARPDGIDSYKAGLIVDDVIALADALGLGRFHLAGHDWGGQIAWLTAAKYPERLKTLNVLSRPHPAAFAAAFRDDPEQANRSRHHKAFQDMAMADRLLADDARAIRSGLAFEVGSADIGDPDRAPKRRMSDADVDAHMSVIGNRAAMDAALNWYRAAFAGGSALARDDVPKITVPTLYLWGEEDMSVGRMAAEGTAVFVNAPFRFVAVPGAGHFLAEERPDLVNPAIIAHMQDY
ncbi:MAG: alpha/beta hydrolase [Pseudomonadota bacterium]|nr:alpha/beta hydrolase [Pseudomonadota bacterium]